MNDYDYLITQLDLLIGFLDVSDEKIYNQIKKHDRFNLGITIEQLYKKDYKNYSSHIANSAFLLGFAHFEDYLTKRLTEFLIKHPNKNKHKVTLQVVKEKGEGLATYLACQQAKNLVFSEKVNFIEKNIKGLTSKYVDDLRYANDVRNCLMHNNGIADERLKRKYKEGEKIMLSSGEVNGLGLTTRWLARKLWENTNHKQPRTTNLKAKRN